MTEQPLDPVKYGGEYVAALKADKAENMESPVTVWEEWFAHPSELAETSIAILEEHLGGSLPVNDFLKDVFPARDSALDLQNAKDTFTSAIQTFLDAKAVSDDWDDERDRTIRLLEEKKRIILNKLENANWEPILRNGANPRNDKFVEEVKEIAFLAYEKIRWQVIDKTPQVYIRGNP